MGCTTGPIIKSRHNGHARQRGRPARPGRPGRPANLGSSGATRRAAAWAVFMAMEPHQTPGDVGNASVVAAASEVAASDYAEVPGQWDRPAHPAMLRPRQHRGIISSAARKAVAFERTMLSLQTATQGSEDSGIRYT